MNRKYFSVSWTWQHLKSGFKATTRSPPSVYWSFFPPLNKILRWGEGYWRVLGMTLFLHSLTMSLIFQECDTPLRSSILFSREQTPAFHLFQVPYILSRNSSVIGSSRLYEFGYVHYGIHETKWIYRFISCRWRQHTNLVLIVNGRTQHNDLGIELVSSQKIDKRPAVLQNLETVRLVSAAKITPEFVHTVVL